jgi:hypothetical protein
LEEHDPLDLLEDLLTKEIPMKTYPIALFDETDENEFVTEASTLGWKPGEYYCEMSIEDHTVGKPEIKMSMAFTMVHKDDRKWVYENLSGRYRLYVYND